MNTMEEHDFDYQKYTRETEPDPALIQRGTADRQQRLAAAMQRMATRIDVDILRQFEQLVPEGESCERMINLALREWLVTRDMKDLVRIEIERTIRHSLAPAGTDLALP
ncbi:MAG: hypothetical protein ACKV2V_17035 [Blastocatellia bacterium]